MESLVDAAAPTVTIQLGGTEYTLSPITLGDLAELQRALEEKVVQEARNKMALFGEDMPEETRQDILSKALVELDRMQESGGADAMAEMQGLWGMGMILWMSLRRRHPAITREEIMNSLSIGDLTEVQAKMDLVTGLGNESPETPQPEVPRDQSTGE